MAQKPTDTKSGQIRLAAAVIIITMLCWMGATWIGGKIGLPVRYAFLFDLAALAAFFWALIVLFLVWRQRQRHED